MASSTAAAQTSLVKKFKLYKLLNQDQGGRRIVLQGTIEDKPALLLVERGAFETQSSYLQTLPQFITNIKDLGDNDIYHWYLANSITNENETGERSAPSDLKLSLIFPCNDKHIKKYSFQQVRTATETPEIYRDYVRPYMRRCRDEGRLNWVFNIIEGRSEQEDVLFRSKEMDPKDDYLLLPDLNWDRKTLGSLHLLALVERRDVWSVRDLTKKDVRWLRALRSTLARTVGDLYPGVEADMLKFYVHYQPTYYHFHIHIVHVNIDPTATQATGKALGLENVISQLETMAGGEEAGMADVELSYSLGEASDLWTEVFLPLKLGHKPKNGQ